MLVIFHQAEIIIVKHFILGRNNKDCVGVEPFYLAIMAVVRTNYYATLPTEQLLEEDFITFYKCTKILPDFNVFFHIFCFSALQAFTYLSAFDLFTLLIYITSLWFTARERDRSGDGIHIFSQERVEILLVFSSVVISILGAIFILKESLIR